MNLADPIRLWLLLAVPALAALYVWARRRRRKYAVRFTNVSALRSALPHRRAWRTHAPAALMAVALVVLVVAFAGPTSVTRVPKESATVMLVIDTSASMEATDVEPSRLEAAIEAATAFVGDLPAQHRVGLVSFDRLARVVATPTTDHESVIAGIESLTLGFGTAAGDGLLAAVDAVQAAQAGANVSIQEGAAIVLLSDGVTTVGRPVTSAAIVAASAGIPVTTIAFGTDGGTVFVQGQIVPVPADPVTMAQVAEVTSGKFFEAVSDEELRSVYDDIGARVGFDEQTRDASGVPLAAGALLLGAAVGLAAISTGRLV